MYDAPNSLIAYRVVPMNVILPTFTRGPGKATGSFALESAIDELAYKLKMDPIDFRLKNQPDKDPSNGKPWSSRKTAKCLELAARPLAGPGETSSRVKTGMEITSSVTVSVAVHTRRGSVIHRRSSSSRAAARTSRAEIEPAASDLGTGSNTIIAQTAADSLGLPMNRIAVKIGDSSLPPAAGSVGSVGAASFANAVNDGCVKITDELIAKSGKQFFVRPTAEQMMISENLTEFQTRVDAKPPAEADKFSTHSFNANFAEVWVDGSTGMVRVALFLAVTGARKNLESQDRPLPDHRRRRLGYRNGADRGIGHRPALGQFCHPLVRRLPRSRKSRHRRHGKQF